MNDRNVVVTLTVNIIEMLWEDLVSIFFPEKVRGLLAKNWM